MQACHRQTWMMTAPAFIVAVADMAARSEADLPIYIDENSPHWELKRAIRDTAIAVENMLLEADAQGLDTGLGSSSSRKYARFWAFPITSLC